MTPPKVVPFHCTSKLTSAEKLPSSVQPGPASVPGVASGLNPVSCAASCWLLSASCSTSASCASSAASSAAPASVLGFTWPASSVAAESMAASCTAASSPGSCCWTRASSGTSTVQPLSTGTGGGCSVTEPPVSTCGPVPGASTLQPRRVVARSKNSVLPGSLWAA